MKIVHIGFGKTGTTYLQNFVFPKISKILDIPYIEFNSYYDKKIKKKKIRYSPLENYSIKKLPKKFFMSSEDLIGIKWQMEEMTRAFEINKIFFDKDCTILITIRRPSDIFNSIYIQNIHNFNLVEERSFFINKNNQNLTEDDEKKFNLFNFSYKTIIDLYKSFYHKVIVIKYEEISNLKFLKKILPKDNQILSNSEFTIGKNKEINKSFSRIGVRIFFFLNNFFNLEKFQKSVENKIKYNPINLYQRLCNKLFAQMNIRNKIHSFDKINFLYSKYKINLNNLPVDIFKLDKEYEDTKY